MWTPCVETMVSHETNVLDWILKNLAENFSSDHRPLHSTNFHVAKSRNDVHILQNENLLRAEGGNTRNKQSLLETHHLLREKLHENQFPVL